jgi:tRNA(Ile)-lysidine synthase
MISKHHPATLPYLQSGCPVLVGVSGGRDSIALLTLLSELQGCHPIACHVHHGIRKCTADDDCRYTEQYARSLGIPCLVEYVDVPRMAARKKMSLETTARLLRQEAFLRWKEQYPNCVVALAHHRDDQAETILFRLCRGTGRLGGMRAVSTWPNHTTVLRPLLGISREEITQWLIDRGISWQDDESNEDTSIPRNAFRHSIFPQLNHILGRDVRPIICRAARLDDENEKALSQAISTLHVIDPQGRLFLPKVLPLPLELRKAILLDYLKKQGVSDLTEEHILRVNTILDPSGSSKVSLPGNKLACRKEARLFVLDLNKTQD